MWASSFNQSLPELAEVQACRHLALRGGRHPRVGLAMVIGLPGAALLWQEPALGHSDEREDTPARAHLRGSPGRVADGQQWPQIPCSLVSCCW